MKAALLLSDVDDRDVDWFRSSCERGRQFRKSTRVLVDLEHVRRMPVQMRQACEPARGALRQRTFQRWGRGSFVSKRQGARGAVLEPRMVRIDCACGERVQEPSGS